MKKPKAVTGVLKVTVNWDPPAALQKRDPEIGRIPLAVSVLTWPAPVMMPDTVTLVRNRSRAKLLLAVEPAPSNPSTGS